MYDKLEIDKDYVFEGPHGMTSLLDLVEGHERNASLALVSRASIAK